VAIYLYRDKNRDDNDVTDVIFDTFAGLRRKQYRSRLTDVNNACANGTFGHVTSASCRPVPQYLVFPLSTLTLSPSLSSPPYCQAPELRWSCP